MIQHLRRLAPQCAALLCAAAALAAPALAQAEYPITSQSTLMSRVQIEDLLVDYYADFGAASTSFDKAYAPDGVLDVNGRIATGRAQIRAFYSSSSGRFNGKFHMLMTNPQIRVHGDTAEADMLWTGILNDDIKKAPHFVEQGREHDEFVRKGGRWYIKHRVITADSGMPDLYDATYKPR